MSIMPGIASVARGSATGGRISSASMSAWKRASSDAASSRYGMPSSRALGRIESSTSVTLRTIRTSWPSSWSRRMSRSYARYVAACPRWVESYGVMPHTYIFTVGPGSNGTTLRAAVSNSFMRAPPSRSVPLQPQEPEGALALVPEVDGEQQCGEGLDPDCVGERAAVERAQLRNPDDEVEDDASRVVVVGAHDDVALQVPIEVAERGRGDEVECRDHAGLRCRRLDRPRHRAGLREHGTELTAHLLEPV